MASVDWADAIAAYLKMTGALQPGAGDVLTSLGNGCQAAVERAIGRTLDTRNYTELYDGNGRARLYLRHDPVWTIASVTVGGSAQAVQANAATVVYPAPRVAIAPEQDSLVMTDGTLWDASSPANVLVSYSAGLSGAQNDAPPADLVTAIVRWAGQLFRDRDRLGISSTTMGGQTSAFTRAIPPDVAEMIGGWRRAFLPVGF